MEKNVRYLDLIKKYECKIVNGRIINKYNFDTGILLEGIIGSQYAIESIGASNENELSEQIFDAFEHSLKERCEVHLHG